MRAVIAEQYKAMREGFGFVDRSSRGYIAVMGPDRANYLQGLLTNDIVALSSGTGCYALYLTPQGRIIADCEILDLGDVLMLDVHKEIKDFLVEKFKELIFTEDVKIVDWTDQWKSYGVYGHSAIDFSSTALEKLTANESTFSILSVLKEHQHCQVSLLETTVIVTRIDEFGELGVSLYIDRNYSESFRNALLASGGTEVDHQTTEVIRVESGRPAFPLDMGPETIPLEVGIEDRAISFTKGCYVGQEVLVRVLHRGKGRVSRKLVGLTFSSDFGSINADSLVPLHGTSLWSDNEQVGHITSAVFSQALSKVIALGYLSRDLLKPGTQVQALFQEGRVDGLVTPMPFV